MKYTIANDGASLRIARLIGIIIAAGAFAGCDPLTAYPSPDLISQNSNPVFTSAATASVPEGSQANVYTATADDPDGDTLSFSLSGGVDQALFAIDATSGALSFNVVPDFENPADSDGNNSYLVELQVDDGNGGTDVLPVTIDVTNINQAPMFTSAASLTVPENWSDSYAATAVDPDLDVLTFSVSGGADQALFSIGAANGLLTFNSPPDFEAPNDSDGDNNYVVELSADDGNGGIASLIVTITATDVSQLEAEVSFPTPDANLGGISDTVVTGNLVDLEDGIVEADDLNFIEVDGQAALQSVVDPSRWSIQIPVDTPTDAFLVVTDSVGGGSVISSLTVENNALILSPDLVSIDTNNNRLLVGDSGGLGAVVAVDLSDGTSSTIADANTGSGVQILLPEASVLDPGNNRVLVIDSILGALISLDLATGNRILISDATTGTGPSFGNPLSIALDAANNRALVTDAGLEALLAVDLASGNRTILSDASVGTGPSLSFPTAVVFDAANNRALVAEVALLESFVLAVDLASGDRTVVADDSTGAGLDFPVSMVLDSAASSVLVGDINQEALISIDLANGAGTVISDATTGTGPLLSFPRSIALDETGNQAFVVDIALDEILSVDLTSGDRTPFAETGTGSGPSLSGTSAVALHAASNRAVVTELNDDGAGLAWVEVAGGNRSVLSDAATGSGPDFVALTGLVLDAQNNRALVLDSMLDALISVDLTSGNRTILSDPVTGSGGSFAMPTSVALDEPNALAFVTDDALDALVSVDLGSGNRTVVSDMSTGSGPLITTPTAVVLDLDNTRALVVDSGLDALLSVDLANGNRTVIADNGTGNGPAFSEPLSLAFDAGNNRALVADGLLPATLLWVDLATGDRAAVSALASVGPILVNIPSVILDQAHDRAFAVDVEIEGLLVVELGTGQRAVVSR